MKCEKHPDRDGILTVDLPSIGIRRYMCLECRVALQLGLSRGVSNDRPKWMDAQNGEYDSIHHSDIKHELTFPKHERTIWRGGKT